MTEGTPLQAKPIEYFMQPGAPNLHLVEVGIAFTPKTGGGTVDFAIPAWRPGRYQIQNYARNVQQFAAVDEKGTSLRWEKIDKNTWRVTAPKNGAIQVTYKVYANTLDAGSTLLNDEEFYWNGTNVLMYVGGQKNSPTRLTLKVPGHWKVATGLKPGPDVNVFEAPDYDTLADAPGIASPTLDITPFEVEGVPYYLVFQGQLVYQGRPIPKNQIIINLKKAVGEALKIFGPAPYPNYWFLFHSVPDGRFHGVEHLNSTSITVPSSAFSNPATLFRFYSIAVHEFFHAWNVKRIHPQVLGPFDYSREVYTRNLWVAEGITSYYDDLLCKRAAIFDQKAYLALVASSINSLQSAPGRKVTPVSEASFDEWLTPDDARNVETDFYTKGALLGFLLDMEVRQRTENRKSLDDVMRYLNETYAKKGIGYPEDGVQKALEAVSGSSFSEFFSKYVYGVEELPYNTAVHVAGLEVVEVKLTDRAEATLGITLTGDERQAVISNVVPHEAGSLAGLDKGDIFLAIDGKQTTAGNLNEVLRSYKPGDKALVHVFRRGMLREFPVTFQGGGNLSYDVRAVSSPTLMQKQVLAAWLNEAGQ
ncbi:MAG: PDZ domain-containing protein [Blastocatellia bacterium]|nr:PDZ domain-containing protein [Blastocatellia bacterium]